MKAKLRTEKKIKQDQFSPYFRGYHGVGVIGLRYRDKSKTASKVGESDSSKEGKFPKSEPHEKIIARSTQEFLQRTGMFLQDKQLKKGRKT